MQIVINTETGMVDVITLSNGMPVLPIKKLNTNNNTLTPQEKAQYQAVVDLIISKAS